MSINPIEKISESEISHLFLSFCSFCALLETKKINLANIFLLVLKEQKFRDLLISYCDFKSEYDALKYFLFFDNLCVRDSHSL